MGRTGDHGLLKDRWIVHLLPSERPSEMTEAAPVLEFLDKFLERFPDESAVGIDKRIRVGTEIGTPYMVTTEEGLHVGVDSLSAHAPFERVDRLPPWEKISGAGRIRTVLLLHPAHAADKRWRTIGLPTASLFLGSPLTRHNFKVTCEILPFPMTRIKPQWLDFDFIGVTVYEDLLPEILDLLRRLRPVYHGMIGAGGPMVTLNPMASMAQLRGVNLMLRGESEFILPDLLAALDRGRPDTLLNTPGFFFFAGGQLILSEFHTVHRPNDFSSLPVDLSFVEPHHLSGGLEINVSRGCRRGCTFCSRPQGSRLRALPALKLEAIISEYEKKLISFDLESRDNLSMNINDDDILQDLGLAREVFSIIKRSRLRLWGVQTSAASFFNCGDLDEDALALVDDPALYVDGRPLLWIGTDGFAVDRGKRLGKPIPSPDRLEALVSRLQQLGVRNFHYWICTDHQTTWKEFIDELVLIVGLLEKYSHFGVLAHSPFLIPYPSTPIYRRLSADPETKELIRYRAKLPSSRAAFRFHPVERIETRFSHLNRLLMNRPPPGGKGFLDTLRDRNYFRVLTTTYYYLRQERLSTSPDKRAVAEGFHNLEHRLEAEISARNHSPARDD